MARGSENFLGDGINRGGTHRTRCGGFTGGRSQGSFSCECYNDELLSKILVNFCEAFRLSYPPDQQAASLSRPFCNMDPALSSPGWLLPPLTDCFIARPGLPRSHRAPPGSAQRPPAAGYFVFKVRGVFSIDGLILSLALFCSVIFTERSSALKEPYYPQRNQILLQEETFAFNCRICSSRFPKTPKPSAYPSSPSQKPQNF